MDQGLIDRWNSRVSPVDTIYHLGDFSFYARLERVLPILERLNGNIKLVPGNHDYDPWHKWSIDDVAAMGHWEILPKLHEFKHNGELYVLCHYPLESWNHVNRRHNSFMLHGHLHGSGLNKRLKGRWDVGVDANDWYPISIDEARERCLQAVNEQNQPLPEPEH